MENYENDTYSENTENLGEDVREAEDELIEAEMIEADELAEPTESEAAELADDSEEVLEEDEDISLVAEGLATIRNPFVIPTDERNSPANDGAEDIVDADGMTKNSARDECGLFTGFNLKKALVTALLVLLTAACLASAMVAAVKVSEDKTRRESDFDMTVDEAAENAARENADVNEPVEPHEDEKQFKVTLDFFDRDDVELYTTKITLEELLEKSGITLEEGEECTIGVDTMLGSETVVAFDKYTTKTRTETEAIPFETTVYETDLIPRGSTTLVQNGVNGESKKTYLDKLKNGEVISTELVGEETTAWPQDYIYELGVGGSFVGSDGNTYSYSWRKTVTATYYYLPNDPHTYLGNTPNHQTIAVDMNVIPLGTWVYVKNNRYDFGLRQAQDIGGAIKGDMIDIWLDGSEAGYSSFHQEGVVYDMEIYYVD